ncbi:MAG TPA: HAD family phosphatase [Chlamydiales bacterium]|nr:HAD family phosphatase [Chlamydiales bacterium]
MTSTLFSEQPIKAIIFDCDGTLVDSEESHFFAWRRAVQHFGGDLTPEQYRTYVGKPGATIARLLAQKTGKDCTEELFALKREYFMEYLDKGLPPIKDTLAFIHRLIEVKKQLGIKLAVASGTVKPEIIKNLHNLGIEDVFDVVLSGHEDLHDYHDPEGVNKPKPYIYLHAAKLLGVSPTDCIAVEDSTTGVLSGRNAGCFTIAIPNQYTINQDLSAANLKINSLSGIGVEEFLQMVQRKKTNE